jgi:hypothetical protein
MLKVFMVGLIYFDGCDEEVMHAYAPDGRVAKFGVVPHFASLWIQADQVNTDATVWPERETHSIDGVPVIEFRIPDPTEIVFPVGDDQLSCAALDAVMPKLTAEKKNAKDEYFEIDPDNALTIATVTIPGGELVPYDLKNKWSGVVEWRIANPSGLEITAEITVESTTEEWTIVLKADVDAEVVLSNIHNIPLNASHDSLRSKNHVQLFKQLNLGLGDDVTLVSHRPGPPLSQLVTNNKYLGFLRLVDFTCGDTPPCCSMLVREAKGS